MRTTLLLSLVLAKVFALESPIEGYGVMIPEWEVEVAPGVTANLSGTVQEVHYQLNKLNPEWDVVYLTDSDEAESRQRSTGWTSDAPRGAGQLDRRTDFKDASYQCDNWPKGRTYALTEGIRYLRRVEGRPTNGPGPGNCGRVSCSYNSAIWWCNDSHDSKTLNGFDSIADGAQFIIDKCFVENNTGFPHHRMSGQAFHPTNWNVIIRDAKC